LKFLSKSICYVRVTARLFNFLLMGMLLSNVGNGLLFWGLQFLPLTPTITANWGWKLVIASGIILGMLNYFVRPILKFIGFPFMIFSFWLFIFVINGIILSLVEKIINSLNIENVQFATNGWMNFAIIVVIFTLFNTIYGTIIKLFFK
jgi:putative membrane protein